MTLLENCDCNECGAPSAIVVVIGETSDGTDTNTAFVCLDCLRQAVELAQTERVTKWRYRIYCPDCQGDNDSQGCFGGGSKLSDEDYDTFAEADDAGAEKTSGTIWAYDVERYLEEAP